MMYIDLNSES
jgi:hypothetical protein